jgi:formamidopyrimidine-DNA glycosylase
MPELPEVETLRRGIEATLIGRTVRHVEVPGRRSVRRQEKAEFVDDLLGRTLIAARRRGKYLLVDLDDGAVLVVHLRMSGQLLHLAEGATRVLHTHVVLGLDDLSEVHFVDPRTFGELFVSTQLDERRAPVELVNIGLDPLLEGVDAPALAARLRHRKTTLKGFLLDQREIAGIGNIYGDEICFSARLRPERRTESLTRPEARRVAASIEEILAGAVELGGSSLKDARYRDLYGGLGGFQTRHAVYDRAGKPCLRCSGTIVRARVAGRSSYSCRRCQR